MKKNRSKEFIINTIFLFIGKFSTQFMSLILLPLFTHYLLTEDYGTVDLLQTYITLFVPILTLRIDSAIFRFLIDKRDDEAGKESVITNIFIIMVFSILITVVIYFLSSIFIDFAHSKYVIINLIISIISSITLQLLRGLGKNLQYSISSIITGILTLLCNILLIIIMKFGAESILISSSIANIFCIIYVTVICKIPKYIKLNKISKNEISKIIKYSIPMIPNSLSWWIVNVSDRTIISFFLGVSFNGIYTISCKFSNIINSIFSIFNMSWQETATLHINDKDKENFFSDIINNLLNLFSTFSILILVILPIFYNLIIGNDYVSSYNYIPILLYANSWNVLIGLIGGIYIALKKTKEIANTTIYSAVLNIIINLLLIKFIGLYAACISTLLSYIVIGIYRYLDCQKYIKLKINFSNIVTFTIIFIISSIIYIINNSILNIINLIIVIIYCIFLNKNIIKYLYNKIKKNY